MNILKVYSLKNNNIDPDRLFLKHGTPNKGGTKIQLEANKINTSSISIT